MAYAGAAAGRLTWPNQGRRAAIAIARPSGHQFAASFKRVASPVCLFGLVADAVRERMLSELAREVRLVAGPVAKR